MQYDPKFAAQLRQAKREAETLPKLTAEEMLEWLDKDKPGAH